MEIAAPGEQYPRAPGILSAALLKWVLQKDVHGNDAPLVGPIGPIEACRSKVPCLDFVKTTEMKVQGGEQRPSRGEPSVLDPAPGPAVGPSG